MLFGNGAGVDILAGSSGWAGAGLLGLVLAWLLLKHLPAKDLQIERLMAIHATDSKEERMVFKSSLDAVVKHCQEENQKIVDAFSEDLVGLKDAVKKLSDSIDRSDVRKGTTK